MFTWFWIVGIVFLGLAGRFCGVAPKQLFSCEDFEREASFDPYEAIDSMWKAFYFWSNSSDLFPISFSMPTKDKINRFRVVTDAMNDGLSEAVEWRRATLIMEPRPGIQVLLVYQGTPGAFRALIKKEHRNSVRPLPAPWLKLADVRMKIVDRYMGIMGCEDLSKYALSRLYEVPATEELCKRGAIKLGFPLDKGISYITLTDHKREIDDEL